MQSANTTHDYCPDCGAHYSATHWPACKFATPGVCAYPTTAPQSALDTQVGGDHYKKMPLQPWEIIDRNNLDFWQGNAIKYVMRYEEKGGVEDLRKAIHYIEYLIERYQKRQVSNAKQ